MKQGKGTLSSLLPLPHDAHARYDMRSKAKKAPIGDDLFFLKKKEKKANSDMFSLKANRATKKRKKNTNTHHHSTANPQVSSTACVNLSNNVWYESYGGISIRLKHVCAFGRFNGDTSTQWMVNKRGPAAPVLPCSALKPCNGTRDEPVTNCNSLARISSEYDSTACQNHCTTGVSAVQCFKL